MADNGNGVNPVFKYLQGRTTTMIWFFSIVGTGLQVFHKLDYTYVGFVGLILTVAMGHSIKEDWHGLKLNGNGHKDDDDSEVKETKEIEPAKASG